MRVQERGKGRERAVDRGEIEGKRVTERDGE